MEDIKIVVNILMEVDKLSVVMWIKFHLEELFWLKVLIVDEIWGESDELYELDEEYERLFDKVFECVFELFNDYWMFYFDDNELCDDVLKRFELKFLCWLINLCSNEDDDYYWVWMILLMYMLEELKS